MTAAPIRLLEGIRVLDLTNSRAELAGRLLRRPRRRGDEGRAARRGRFAAPSSVRRTAGSDGGSLYWQAVAAGKQSVVLDLDDASARQTLREMARRVDILVESFDPGTMEAWGLGYEALSALNPRLIYVSVTPYGQKGPKAQWPATELTLEASGGRVGLQGDRDRPPIPVGYPQAAFHAGGQAAADAIIALNEREVSGLGQRLDTSMQEAIVWSLMNFPGYPSLTGGDPPGYGDDRATAVMPARRGPFLRRQCL